MPLTGLERKKQLKRMRKYNKENRSELDKEMDKMREKDCFREPSGGCSGEKRKIRHKKKTYGGAMNIKAMIHEEVVKARAGQSRVAGGDWKRSTLDELVEMAGETMDYDDWRGMKSTREVQYVAKNFSNDVQNVLAEWVKRNPGKLKDEYDDSDLYDEKGSYLVYMTLAGHGVGIWDGDWDHFFVDDSDIKDLQRFLEGKLHKYVDDTGGGDLNFAFANAALAQTESEE